ncbi:MAG: type I DNA topoisomerase [Bacillota bacterium]|jgi:DNA topoisomerase-1|nr:type I DNA topoisomerase [Bacillota bacterium]HOB91801.1 type I DNA topoisomerase [Bacillota bacterium]HPZ53942.1 type I DNA topoisomerase [Bacillota bacterium]
MKKSLVVVESPTKAKTISRFLGRGYQVKASMGHVRDLPKSKLGVDIDDGYKPTYINVRGMGGVIRELKAAAKDADTVLFATDPDREGEAISWHLAHLLGIDPASKCRIEFNEITKNAIREAIKNPRQIDIDYVNAQQARRVLDRLVGYKLSPFLWRKVKRGLSAGRVQSVALRLIVDREREIEAFVPEEYWTIEVDLEPLAADETTKPASFEGQESASFRFTARLVSESGKKVHIPNEDEADRIRCDLEQASFVVTAIARKEKRRSPSPPFTTSTLQQEASRKLRFSPSRTMRVAQQLYEGIDIGSEGTVGLITYMRTDSTRVASEAQTEARSYIESAYGKQFVPSRPYQYKSRGGAQDAHEAIRPTSSSRLPDALKPYLTADQYKLYRLIWLRFIASQMSAAVYDSVAVDIQAGVYGLRASGSRLIFPGFLSVYEEGRDAATEADEGFDLPQLDEGEQLRRIEVRPEQHFTQPPPRYTEATLIRTLEENGVGRPSTYVSIIDTIRKRNYVYLEDRQFRPTDLGVAVNDLLAEYFPSIVDIEFTANLEQDLDKIAEGQAAWDEVVDDFYKPFEQTLETAMKNAETVSVPDQESDEKCPQCGRNLVYKDGRYGRFLACPGFPECRFTKPLIEELDVACPECAIGRVVKRRSRRGRAFYACSRYPDCRFTSWNEPTNDKCPQCGSYMVKKNSKRSGNQLACSDKTCGYLIQAAPKEN